MTKRALVRTLERERAANTAERARLIETICRLAGNPSQPTELDLHRANQPDPEPKTWVAAPEQHPYT